MPTYESPLAFPKKADKPRLEAYAFYDKLYNGDHFDAFSIKGEKDFTTQYSRLRYIVANFAGLMSRILADMLFGEKLSIDVEKNQDFIDSLIEENQLITQLYESELSNSRRGDAVFKLRIGTRNINNLSEKPTIIIEQVGAALYFPEFDPQNARFTPAKDCLYWTFKQQLADGNYKCYLHKESHYPGYISHQIFGYNEKEEKIEAEYPPEDFGYQPVEETLVDRSLVFHVPNVRSGDSYFGDSDYTDLISLFFALNNRLTKTDNILDKHSDPILAVPPGVIDENGKIRRSALSMFEVDSENPGFNKPEYIVWNANLEAAEKEVDKLLDLLFMFSEIAPATMGADKNGQVDSGRALKFKLLATIRKRNRKMRYYDQMIKDLLETAQKLAIAHKISVGEFSITKPERPKVDWGDGVINDDTEMVDTAVKRIDAGLSSRAGEISKLDGLTPSEAEKKVVEIDKEATIDMPGKSGAPFTEPAKEPVAPAK